MNKVEIFDPAMCCSTGVCGPSVDPELTRVASAVYSLESKGFNIKRYQLTSDPDKFAENEEINRVLSQAQLIIYPKSFMNQHDTLIYLTIIACQAT